MNQTKRKLTKKERSKIRQLANVLPRVFTRHAHKRPVKGRWVEKEVSEGKLENVFEKGEGSDVAMEVTPYQHEVNHYRQMCHAYEKLGEVGIKKYLDGIKKIQQERNVRFADAKRKSVHTGTAKDTGKAAEAGVQGGNDSGGQ